jgi:hypothetical protein
MLSASRHQLGASRSSEVPTMAREPTREATVKGLRRERAGRYRSADDRFVIEGSGGLWYLTDDFRRDELGQPLVIGPFSSLAEARDGMAAEPSVLKPKAKGRPSSPKRGTKA